MTTRFIVAGIQRAGTTLIRTSLDSHPGVRCVGESFKIRRLWKGADYQGPLGYPAWRDERIARRVGHHLWRNRNTNSYLDDLYSLESFEAVGFKFMYPQTRLFPAVVPYVLQHGIRAIHVIRKNTFKVWLSRLTARARGQFHTTERIEAIQVHVPTDSLIEDLDRVAGQSQQWQEILSGSVPYLPVIYEDFVAAREEGEARMVEFLDLPPASLSSDLVKLNPDRLADIVENFEEVEACLRDSAYAWCLD